MRKFHAKFPVLTPRLLLLLRKLLSLFMLGSLLAACASPGEKFTAAARARNFDFETIKTQDFELAIFRKAGSTSGNLHVYLDGDGSPWLDRRRVAHDPTSRQRLVLELMARDPATAILLGRPCYYLTTAACDAHLWTQARYGETVVNNMVEALKKEQIRHNRQITLVGYSGGGTLAMLIAARLPAVRRVVTVAANLDVEAWTKHHGYSALDASLNPAKEPVLRANVRETHWFGGADTNVPFHLMEAVARRGPQATVRLVPEFDHHCCWSDIWPQPLLGD